MAKTKGVSLLMFSLSIFMFSCSCAGGKQQVKSKPSVSNSSSSKLILEIDGKAQNVLWQNNKSIEALKETAKMALK